MWGGLRRPGARGDPKLYILDVDTFYFRRHLFRDPFSRATEVFSRPAGEIYVPEHLADQVEGSGSRL